MSGVFYLKKSCIFAAVFHFHRIKRNNALRNVNRKFLLMFFFSVANLLLMHWQLVLTVEYEYPFRADAIWSNVFACLIDTSVFFLVGLLGTWGRVKLSLLITFVSTWLLALFNVVYARFFGHYIPAMAITQVGNLMDGEVAKCILEGFRWVDLCYVGLAFLFGWLYVGRKTMERGWWNLGACLKTLGIVWGAMLASVAAFIVVMGLFRDDSFKVSYTRFSPMRMQYYQAPNNMLFRGGFFRRSWTCREDFFQGKMTLTEVQKEKIEREYKDYSERESWGERPRESRNLIFIIVESYLSATSNLKVDGKEITPFLNQLKRDSSVYYNGHVQSNIKMGESSDGQFIYMTGLLPLKSDITVNLMKGRTVQGLPKVLAEKGITTQSHAIVPTSPTFWEQDAMNDVYGIGRLYSKLDYQGDLPIYRDLNDEQVFEMASQIDSKTQGPFFSMILTMSMHHPYDKCEDHGFSLSDASLTPEYRNYLINCHFFDRQLEKYITALRKSGVYDKSVVVITADHHAHHSLLSMEEGEISEELPLYIVNGGIDQTTAWHGTCNQLDVYTTLLDLFGLTPQWRGFGHTLLKKDYRNSVTEEVQTFSEWIIRSDYFAGE